MLWFFLGFGIGLAYGCFLWWQALKQEDELYGEYVKLLDELIQMRQRRSGPTVRPFNN